MFAKRRFFKAIAAITISINMAYAGSIHYFGMQDSQIKSLPESKIKRLIERNVEVDRYREIKVQVFNSNKHAPSYLLLYLFSKEYHRVEVMRVNMTNAYEPLSIARDYKLTAEEFAQQPGLPKPIECPDPAVEFITFAPNDIDIEQEVTRDVTKAARKHGLNTIELLKKSATTHKYLSYMSCPNLKGNFYNGDANPELITTYDGVISYRSIEKILPKHFQYKVTNIWLACRAYNDPIRASVMEVAQSQKYAAGITDLYVGPSDRTALCTMKAALDGEPMTLAFQDCYKQYDDPADIWGFGGEGADIFGV